MKCSGSTAPVLSNPIHSSVASEDGGGGVKPVGVVYDDGSHKPVLAVPPRRCARPSLSAMIFIVAFVVGVALAVLTGVLVHDDRFTQESQEFDRLTTALQLSMQEQMDGASVLCDQVTALFDAFPDMTLGQFATAAHPLVRLSFPWVGFVPLTADADRAATEAKLSAYYNTSIQFTTHDGSAVRGTAAEYWPIVFAVNMTSSVSVVGHDLGTHAEALAAIQASAHHDHHQGVGSAPLAPSDSLFPDTALMLSPVYTAGCIDAGGTRASCVSGVSSVLLHYSTVFQEGMLPVVTDVVSVAVDEKNSTGGARRVFLAHAGPDIDGAIQQYPSDDPQPTGNQERTFSVMLGRLELAVTFRSREVGHPSHMLSYVSATMVFLGTLLLGALVVLVISRRQRTLQMYRASEEKLQQAEAHQKWIRSYNAQITHDLRTPVHAFRLTVMAMEETLRSASASTFDQLMVTLRERTVEADAAVTVMLNTVANVLQFAKGADASATHGDESATPMGSLHLTSVNVRHEIDNLTKAMCNYLASGEVPVTIQVAPDVSRLCLLDLSRFNQQILNFVANAVKFTKEGAIRLEITVQDSPIRSAPIGARATHDTAPIRVTQLMQRRAPGARPRWLLVSCIDSGVGVAHPEKLFRPFSQLQSDMGGTGLGLYAVRSQARAMGGSSGLHNVLPEMTPTGTGSCFWFSTPYVPVDGNKSAIGESTTSIPRLPGISSGSSGVSAGAGEKSGAAARRVSTVSARPPLHILVVDDTALNRRLLRRILLALEPDFQVDTAVDGADALKRMQSTRYHLVFMDLVMPDMSGYDVTRSYFEWASTMQPPPEAPTVYALTGNVNVEADCLAAGMKGVLTKPAERDQLRAVIRSCQRQLAAKSSAPV